MFALSVSRDGPPSSELKRNEGGREVQSQDERSSQKMDTWTAA